VTKAPTDQYLTSFYATQHTQGNWSPARNGHAYLNVPYSQSEVILQEFKKLSKSELSQSEVIVQEFKKLSFSVEMIAHINQHILQNMQ
jgi:hypothetical protein